MKKKVLFTATVDSHILNFHIPYLKYFKDNGYEVHVATNGTEKIPYCDVKHTVSFERSPFRLNNLKARKQLKNIIDTEQFEIIHTHTPMGSVVTRLAALNARKKFNTRVIYTAHGFHFYDGAPVQNWLFFYPVEKYLARYTDTLITINQEDYQRAKKNFKTRVEYVPGVGIDPEKIRVKMTAAQKLALRKSLGLKKDDYVLIYAAELSKRKRQLWLINALSDLLKKNPKLQLLLPGKDSMDGKLQAHVTKLGLEERVHFLGFRKDIPQLMAISNLSVSASVQEGLPVNILEAMFAGLPVVATDCRGCKDLVQGYNGGAIIEKEDIKSFVSAVQLKLFDGQSTKEIQVSSYTIESTLMDVDAVYRTTVA